MANTISLAGEAALRKVNVEPSIVLVIEGVSTRFGVRTIKRTVKIGDSGLQIGNFKIAQLTDLESQATLISINGTTTRITQNISPDTGVSQSITSMKIAIVDKDLVATQLITPNEETSPAFDLLGRRCKVWLGFAETRFPEDYTILFRGIIDDIEAGAGRIVLNIAHPLTKARAEAFQKVETTLNGAIDDNDDPITVVSTAGFLEPYTGADGNIDETIKLYVRIDDEVIRYESVTGTTFATLERGALGTTAASHDSGATVESFYRLTGDAMNLALKILLSGKNGPFASDIAISNFVNVNSSLISNAIFFRGFSAQRDYGIVTGDYITVSGATEGANNFSNRIIELIEEVDGGSYIVASGSALVQESNTSAVISFRSQYDTLGEGLSLSADEVDVQQFERLFDLFLSGFNYDFYIKDTIEGKKFIEEQIFAPSGCYGLPRNSQISVGIHLPPVSGTDIRVLDANNVINPGDLKIRRSTGINFQNTIVYKFDEQVLEEKLIRVTINTDATSRERIPVGTKALTIESKGMRSSLSGVTLANSASTRRLNKYKFGAEFIENVKVNFKTGMLMDIGDIVLVDLGSLKISDVKSGGTRSGGSRLFQIDNKTLDIKGEVILKLVDTNFSQESRFAVIAPSSLVKSGISQTSYLIKQSFSGKFGQNEFKKWENLLGASIRVHNNDYSVSGTGVLDAVVGNQITLDTALGFVPTEDMVMDLDEYDNQPEKIKQLFAFLSDDDNDFADGGIPYALF